MDEASANGINHQHGPLQTAKAWPLMKSTSAQRDRHYVGYHARVRFCLPFARISSLSPNWLRSLISLVDWQRLLGIGMRLFLTIRASLVGIRSWCHICKSRIGYRRSVDLWGRMRLNSLTKLHFLAPCFFFFFSWELESSFCIYPENSRQIKNAKNIHNASLPFEWTDLIVRSDHIDHRLCYMACGRCYSWLDRIWDWLSLFARTASDI